MKVRLAHPSDIAALHRLRQSVLENRLSDPRQITKASYLPYVEALSAWVAEVDKAIVGFGAVDASEATIRAQFVDPGSEGHGVGQAVLDRMVSWAREKQLVQLSLGTEKGTRAEAFYKRSGWIEASTIESSETRLEFMLARGRIRTRGPLFPLGCTE